MLLFIPLSTTTAAVALAGYEAMVSEFSHRCLPSQCETFYSCQNPTPFRMCFGIIVFLQFIHISIRIDSISEICVAISFEYSLCVRRHVIVCSKFPSRKICIFCFACPQCIGYHSHSVNEFRWVMFNHFLNPFYLSLRAGWDSLLSRHTMLFLTLVLQKQFIQLHTKNITINDGFLCCRARHAHLTTRSVLVHFVEPSSHWYIHLPILHCTHCDFCRFSGRQQPNYMAFIVISFAICFSISRQLMLDAHFAIYWIDFCLQAYNVCLNTF